MYAGPTYQEIMPVKKDPNQVQWCIINPTLFLDDSEPTTNTYNTLCQVGGAGQQHNQHKELVDNDATNSEEYAKLAKT